MEKDFVAWLIAEIEKRGWTNSELARRAGLVPSTISMVLSEQKRPGLDFCVGIGRALGEPPEKILRLAGLLPPLPPAVEEEKEIIDIVRSLSPEGRAFILRMLRGLKSGAPVTHQTETTAPQVGDLEREIEEFVEEFPELSNIIDEARARNLSEPAMRTLMLNARIFNQYLTAGDLSFAELYRKLSGLFNTFGAY